MTPNLGSVVAEAWERARTLQRYGREPLTVAWWKGAAFVRVWDWRTGQMTWKPFQTDRPEPPMPDESDWKLFESRYVFDRL